MNRELTVKELKVKVSKMLRYEEVDKITLEVNGSNTEYNLYANLYLENDCFDSLTIASGTNSKDLFKEANKIKNSITDMLENIIILDEIVID